MFLSLELMVYWLSDGANPLANRSLSNVAVFRKIMLPLSSKRNDSVPSTVILSTPQMVHVSCRE